MAGNSKPRSGWFLLVLVALGCRAVAALVWPEDLTQDRDLYLGLATGLVEQGALVTPGTSQPTAFRPPLTPLLYALPLWWGCSPAWSVWLVNSLCGVLTAVLAAVMAERFGAARFDASRASLTGHSALTAGADRLGLPARSWLAGGLIAVDPLLLRYSVQPMTEATSALMALLAGSVALWVWRGVPIGSRPVTGIATGIGTVVGIGPGTGLPTGLGTDRTTLAAAAATTGSLPSVAESRPDHQRPDDRRRIVSGALLAGGLMGLAVLCRPTFAVWGLFVGVGGLFALPAKAAGTVTNTASVPIRSGWRAGWCWSLGYVLGGALVIAPWVVRNAWVMQSPIVTTTHGGYTLLLANNPVFYREVARERWGTVWEGVSLARWQAANLEAMQADLGQAVIDEVTADRWQQRRAWQMIAEDPQGFIAAAAYRWRSLVALAPRGPSTASRRGLLHTGIAVATLTLFALALAGGWRWWWHDQRIVLMGGSLAMALLVVHTLYWCDTRMRAPCHPWLAVAAAGLALPRPSRRTDLQ